MLQDAHHDPGGRVPAGAFEVELALEGLIDRFDGLTQGLEQARAGAFGLALAGRAQQPQPLCGQGGLELGAVVVPVCRGVVGGGPGWESSPGARRSFP